MRCEVADCSNATAEFCGVVHRVHRSEQRGGILADLICSTFKSGMIDSPMVLI